MKSFVSVNEVNELCEALILDFMKSTKHICVDIEGFITDYLNLNIVYIPFAETDTSKFGFLSDGKQGLWVYRNKKKEYVVFPKFRDATESTGITLELGKSHCKYHLVCVNLNYKLMFDVIDKIMINANGDISIHFVNNTVLCYEEGEFVNAAC